MKDRNGLSETTLLQEFLHGMSHDVREPLRAIGAFSGLLIKDAGNLTEKQLGFAHRIHRASQRINGQFEILADIQAVCEPASKRSGSNLEEMLIQVHQECTGRANGVVNPLVFEGALAAADIDRRQMRIALAYLLGFLLPTVEGTSPPQLVVKPLVSAPTAGETGFTIEIPDNASHRRYDKKQMLRLFLDDPSDRSKVYPGLMLVRIVAQNHGGDCWVQQLTSGLTVCVTVSGRAVDA